MIESISITNGRPTKLLPLGYILIISMIKDIKEDMRRHRLDKVENKRKAMVYRAFLDKNRLDRSIT